MALLPGTVIVIIMCFLSGFGVSQQNTLGGGGGGGAGVGMFPDLGKLVKAMTEKPVLDLAGDKSAAGALTVLLFVCLVYFSLVVLVVREIYRY